MSVAIIGTGNIGSRLARRFAEGGVDVIIAARTAAHAEQTATTIGHGVGATSIEDAIASADSVVLAVPFPAVMQLITEYRSALDGKVVIDPSNNITFENGAFKNLNPEGVSAGQQVAAALPSGARYVKAFGTLSAARLDETATASGEKVALFYATDDDAAGETVAGLMVQGGWVPVKAGGVGDTARIEVFGDLHPSGRLISAADAHALLAR